MRQAGRQADRQTDRQTDRQLQSVIGKCNFSKRGITASGRRDADGRNAPLNVKFQSVGTIACGARQADCKRYCWLDPAGILVSEISPAQGGREDGVNQLGG